MNLQLIENSNSSRFVEGAAKKTLQVCQRVMDELVGEEQGDASDALRTVMTKLIDDQLEQERNLKAMKALKDKLGKVDIADWPKDIEEEFRKLKEEEDSNNNAVDVGNHPWMKDMTKIFDGNDTEEMPEGDEDLEMTQVV